MPMSRIPPTSTMGTRPTSECTWLPLTLLCQPVTAAGSWTGSGVGRSVWIAGCRSQHSDAMILTCVWRLVWQSRHLRLASQTFCWLHMKGSELEDGRLQLHSYNVPNCCFSRLVRRLIQARTQELMDFIDTSYDLRLALCTPSSSNGSIATTVSNAGRKLLIH